MLRSMTGYGRSEGESQGRHLTIDVKTVNGRYFDFKTRMSRELMFLEPKMRSATQKRLFRGRVEVYVELRSTGEDRLRLDRELLQNYLEMAEEMRKQGVSGELGVADLVGVAGLLEAPREDLFEEGFEAFLLGVLGQALDTVLEVREAEGRNLEEDLRERLEALQSLVEEIERGLTGIEDHYRRKILSRMESLEADGMVEESRLAQEILYFAERSDVSEELTRLRSHLQGFSEFMAESGERSIGKNLDFICQELNREINTILAKASLAEVTHLAVEAKAEIERIREQVQNVE